MALRLSVALCCLLGVVFITQLASPRELPCRPIWGNAMDGLPITSQMLNDVAKSTGLKPKMVVFFLQWPRPGQPGFFPSASLRAIKEFGATPVLTWEPMYLDEKGCEHAIPLKDILSGSYDQYLDDFADNTRQLGFRLIIRLAHEMNLERYHWGTAKDAYGPDSPAIYKELYRYVVHRFKARRAGNALWAFCPNAESLPHPQWHGAAWNRAANYYPGDDVVDILGMDGYNWGLTQTKARHGWNSRWLGFHQIFGPLREELTSQAPDKPIVVFETACAIKGGDRKQWLRGALRAADEWRLTALCWFQADKEVDWRLIEPRDTGALDYLRGNTAPQNGCGPWPD